MGRYYYDARTCRVSQWYKNVYPSISTWGPPWKLQTEDVFTRHSRIPNAGTSGRTFRAEAVERQSARQPRAKDTLLAGADGAEGMLGAPAQHALGTAATRRGGERDLGGAAARGERVHWRERTRRDRVGGGGRGWAVRCVRRRDGGDG
jgi:hypothetical protein